MIKSISLAIIAAALCVSATSVEDVDRNLAAGANLDQFEESYLSYDLHQDLHYFRDDYVNEAFNRKKYVDTKVTMGGQARDMTNRQVMPAYYPFAVGQKSIGKMGVSSDRWDVKKNKQQEYQYIGLYHGYNSNFVVNKLRANMLRRVANSVKSYLPTLDNADANDLKEFKNTVFDEMANIVSSTMKQVDDEIRDQMNENDESSATATVGIITPKYVIIANVGDNRALAYNSMNELINLTPNDYMGVNSDHNVFGARKTRSQSCEPNVKIYARNFLDEDGDPAKIHYVLFESPIVAQLVADEEASKIVLSEIYQHGSSEDNEQKLYEDSVTRLLQTASDRVTGVSKAFFPEFFQKSDFAAILVGLDKDYKNIH